MISAVRLVALRNNSDHFGKKYTLALTVRPTQSLSVNRVESTEEQWSCNLPYPIPKLVFGIPSLAW